MKITFLGTSHGFCEKNQFCSSAVVTVGGRHYIIDAGAPITGLLKTYGMAYTDVAGIFITHSHSDHYMGLMEFIDQIEDFDQYKDVHVNIHVPPEFPYKKINTFLFDNEDGKNRVTGRRIDFVTYPDGVIFDDGNVKITSIPVSHIKNAHSFLVEAEGKKVLFSGDLATDFPDYPTILTEGDGVDLLVLEAAHSRYDKAQNMELFRRTKTRRMIINHRYVLFNTDEMIAKAVSFVGGKYPVDLAFDGMTTEI